MSGLGVCTSNDHRASSRHRIDAICSQLITSRQQTPPVSSLPAGDAAHIQPTSLCDGSVVVKQEILEDSYVSDMSNQTHQHTHHYHHRLPLANSGETHPSADRRSDESSSCHHLSASRDTAADAADKDKPHQSALAALTDWLVNLFFE